MLHTKLNSYELLKRYIESGRNKTERKIQNNTIARFNGNNIAIKFWYTDIVEFLPDNTRILNSGGFKTSTTKERINQFLPDNLRLYQDGGFWYLAHVPEWGDKIPFTDDIMIFPDGSIPSVPDISGDIKIRKDIKRYAKGFIRSLLSGKVESPNGGDCWYCCMVDTKNNKPLGESTGNNDHIKSHMEEKYFVGSLLYRAVNVYRVSPIVYSALGELWNENKLPDNWISSIMEEQLYKSLLKYLYQQFNLPF